MDHYDYGLSEGLSKNNVKVYYYTSNNTEPRNIEKVQTHYSFGNIWSSVNKISKLLSFIYGYFKSFHHAKNNNVNVVHLQFFSFDWLNAIVVVLLKKYPFKKILTVHDLNDFRGNKGVRYRSFILNSFDQIIVHNQFSKKELQKSYKKDNVHIIPHGNYLHSVKPQDYRAKKEDEPIELLFFGQIKKVKGLDLLLYSLAEVKKTRDEIHLTIVGKIWHDDQQYYENLIKELELAQCVACDFRYIPNEEVPEYFRKSDIVVLPYREIYQSGVLLLALSYNRPVITSNLPAFLEIMETGGCGSTFESENVHDLSIKILELNHGKIQEFHKNIPSILNRFNWSDIGEKTIEVYETA